MTGHVKHGDGGEGNDDGRVFRGLMIGGQRAAAAAAATVGDVGAHLTVYTLSPIQTPFAHVLWLLDANLFDVTGLAGFLITAMVAKVFLMYYDRKEKELFVHLGAPERTFESLEEARCLND